MSLASRHPQLYVIAGPNGADKTTFARQFLPRYRDCLEFINADLIAGGLSPLRPETAAIPAGRLMLRQIYTLSAQRHDFGFETTLSGRSYLRLFRQLKQRGYEIHVIFLWLRSVELSLQRVALRVREGGHNVPENVIRRRFRKSIRNLFGEYRNLWDSILVFDNSETISQLIYREIAGQLEIVNPEFFARLSKEQP